MEKLGLILPDVIKNSADDPNFRQIAILQMKRLFPELTSPIAQTVLSNHSEPLEVRKLCLNILQSQENVFDLLPFFKETLRKETNPDMQTALEKLVISLENK